MVRVSENNDTTIAGRVHEVQQEYAAKQRRFFIGFALLEGLLMVPVIVVIFALQLVDRQIGVWILLGIAGIGGFVMAVLLVRLAKSREVALNQARGITPVL